MSGELILVVEDEANIVQLDRMYLEREGFRVQAVGDGQAALEAVERLQPALVVLDVMLPALDGLEVCQRLRAAHNPVAIILATARDEDIDRILGLELGADDYLAKPYNPRELVARVKAILRRTVRADAPEAAGPIHLGDLTLDPLRREVRAGEEPVALRTQEFEVLAVLMSHPGVVFDREGLLRLAWGYDFYGQTRTVDVHVAQLRKKLRHSRVKIETVPGVGYKLTAE
ncbi:MAG: response regulator transcription factor [Chloroflexi bacterium]|nr:response regulator transcription factor [Anaerolineaceae bacterium]NMB90199.1 response regulator transcription factor [Chloroflexota bacterium]